MMKKKATFFVGTFLAFFPCLFNGLSTEVPTQETIVLEKIPPRRPDSVTGSQFADKTSGLTGRERQEAAVRELLSGNVPEFLRKLKPVSLTYEGAKGESVSARIWVTPDYLAIGSDEDFLRIPLTYLSAVEVAKVFDCILPTRKMVDAVYRQSTCHLKPKPLPPGNQMRSSEYYARHQALIRTERQEEGCALGELVSGHKKDVVISNRLNSKSGREAIYGWHRKSGEPIQPLSTIHGERYVDYSHGIRLIYRDVLINGTTRSILDVLQDPDLGPVLTYEGYITRLLKMLRLK
jgi:hypothetical protein